MDLISAQAVGENFAEKAYQANGKRRCAPRKKTWSCRLLCWIRHGWLAPLADLDGCDFVERDSAGSKTSF